MEITHRFVGNSQRVICFLLNQATMGIWKGYQEKTLEDDGSIWLTGQLMPQATEEDSCFFNFCSIKTITSGQFYFGGNDIAILTSWDCITVDNTNRHEKPSGVEVGS